MASSLILKSKKILKRSEFYNFFASELFSKSILLLSLTIISRKVSLEVFGLISLIQLIYYYGTLITDQGINQILIREIAKKNIISYSDYLNILFKKSRNGFIFTIIALCIIYFTENQNFWVSFVYLITIMVYPWISNWYFIGSGRPLISSIANIVQTLSFLVLIIYFFVFNNSNIIYYSFSYFLSVIFSVIVYLFLLHKNPKKYFIASVGLLKQPQILKDINYNFASIIFVQIYVSSSVLLIYLFDSSEHAGIYNAAFRIVNLVTSVASIAATFFLPIFSLFLKTNENKEKVENFFSLNILFAVFLLIGGISNNVKIITMLFGEKFSEGSSIIIILLITSVIIVWNVTLSTLIQAAGLQKFLLISSVITAAINVSFNLVLIPIYGYISAAWIGLLCELIIFIFYLHQVIKMKKIKFSIKIFYFFSLVLIVLVLFFIQWLLELNFIATLSIYFVSFILCAFIFKNKILSISNYKIGGYSSEG